MNIAVCLRQVPSRDWQPHIDQSRTQVSDEHASFELNEPDAYALEEALRLKERHGGEVVACSVGPARVAQVLREALARGADGAIHVEDTRPIVDAPMVAHALASAIRGGGFDLVLTGLQSDDQGHAQTGVMLAERLGVPHATIVMEIQLADGGLRVRRELEGGWFQWVGLPMPAVLTIQSGINQLRYATLKGIMAAKKKGIRTIDADSSVTPSQRILALSVPDRTKRTAMITGTPVEAARELVRRLRDEARVLQ